MRQSSDTQQAATRTRFRVRTTWGVSAAVLLLALTGCGGPSNSDDGASPSSGATASSAADASSGGSAAGDESSSSDKKDAVLSLPPTPSVSNDSNWWPAQPKTLATGAKLPDDYEPATLEHPARNVPKPVMPEEAKQETEAGAQAFLNYYADAGWYAWQTGDTEPLRAVTSSACEKCLEETERVDAFYRQGEWAAGRMEIGKILPGSFTKDPRGHYSLPVKATHSGTKVISNGKVDSQFMPYENDGDVAINLIYTDGAWQYITASPRGV